MRLNLYTPLTKVSPCLRFAAVKGSYHTWLIENRSHHIPYEEIFYIEYGSHKTFFVHRALAEFPSQANSRLERASDKCASCYSIGGGGMWRCICPTKIACMKICKAARDSAHQTFFLIQSQQNRVQFRYQGCRSRNSSTYSQSNVDILRIQATHL